jgi:hypothetical protein
MRKWLVLLAFSVASAPGLGQIVIGGGVSLADGVSGSALCYASSTGNDAHDGSSWTLANADIMSCYDALPSVGGTIYIDDNGNQINSCPATDPAGCGIWIMDSSDPNYGNPLAGWRK